MKIYLSWGSVNVLCPMPEIKPIEGFIILKKCLIFQISKMPETKPIEGFIILQKCLIFKNVSFILGWGVNYDLDIVQNVLAKFKNSHRSNKVSTSSKTTTWLNQSMAVFALVHLSRDIVLKSVPCVSGQELAFGL